MAFVSTRDPQGRRYSLAAALRLGPAPDGGLLLPETIAPLPPEFFAALPEMSLPEMAAIVLEGLTGGELERPALRQLAAGALDFPMPLVPLSDDLAVLELFHGPTLAFKDVGARFLARLLPLAAPNGASTDDDAQLLLPSPRRRPGPSPQSPSPDSGEGRWIPASAEMTFGRSFPNEDGSQSERSPEQERSSDLLVLVATSGDTGGAVAQAFFGVAGTRVAVLYPRGKVSPRQERQFATLGGNVRAFAVDGFFDDCQRLVKQAFADRALSEELGLTSANSINVGRLLPQTIYYFAAVQQLVAAGEGGRPRVFVTPSGNFGNLCAGLLARQLGLEARFLAATNANDVVPEFLESGELRPRPSVATLSNAMDVGDPNNFPRILHLYGGDLEALRRDVAGTRVSDDETLATILRRDRQGYLADPHTAVGLAGWEKTRDTYPEDALGIVLATAHPAKFAEAVEPALGRRLPLPPALAEPLARPLLAEDLANDFGALRETLLAWR